MTRRVPRPPPMLPASHLARFAGIGRLYGVDGLRRLRDAHVAVIGLGGVGSWTVEALARSGVGRLTLVDMDEVCISNTNRQLHALAHTGGMPKAAVLADRVLAINPDCRVRTLITFFTPKTVDLVLGGGEHGDEKPDIVVDAIDGVVNKALLIASCRERALPLVTCGGCAGKQDGTAVRVGDLATTANDRLLKFVRKRLRQEHGFPRGDAPFGIPCVYSAEPSVESPPCPEIPGAIPEEGLTPNCEWGMGTATFVTGAFGFALAGVVVKSLAGARPA